MYFSDLTKKIISRSCLVAGILLLMLIVILTPCMCEVVYKQQRNDTIEQHGLEIVIMVLIPFLCSVILFQFAWIFKIFNKDTALRQLEQQIQHGVISLEHYMKTYQHLEEFDMEKKQAQINTEIEKEKFKKNMKNKISAGMVAEDE